MTSKELLLFVSCCAYAAAGCSASRPYAACQSSCACAAPACGAYHGSSCPAARPGRPYADLWQSYCGDRIEHDACGGGWGESYCRGKWTPLFGSLGCTTCGGNSNPATAVQTGEQPRPPEPVVEWDEPIFPTPTPSPRPRVIEGSSQTGLLAPPEVQIQAVEVAPVLMPAMDNVQFVPAAPETPHSATPTVKTKKLKATPVIELAPNRVR